MLRLSKVACAVLLAAGSQAVEVSAAPREVRTCRIIDRPGAYRLARVITATEDNLIAVDSLRVCILIRADFVTLDLGGNTIVGPGTVASIGIGSFQFGDRVFDGIRVHSGAVTNFELGIFFAGHGHTVEHVRAHHNTDQGIRLGVFGSAGHRVAGNAAYGNGRLGIAVNCPSTLLDNVALGHTDGDIVTNPLGGGGFGAACTRSGNSPAP